MADLPDKKTDRDAIVYGGLLLVTLTLLFIIPILLAWPLVRYLAPKARTVEVIAVGSVGALYLALDPAAWISAHWRWMASLTGLGSGSVTDVPWAGLAALVVVFAALGALLSKTVFGGKVKAKITKALPNRKKPAGDHILPTEAEREATQRVIVSAPGQPLTIDAGVHTIDVPAIPVGQRRFPIGFDKNGQPITIGENEIRTHGLIFGSTGSGKSETIKVIAGGLLDLGWHGMILDLKEDAATGGLMDWCREYADFHAMPYQQFHLSDQNPQYWFSPLHGMGSDAARDTILASQEFEAAYYRALNEKQLGQLVQLLYLVHEIDPVKYPTPNVYDIGKILAAPDLPAATREMVATLLTHRPGQYTKDEFDSLLRPDKAMTEAAGGLGARLTAMYQTRVGRVSLRPGADRIQLDVTKPGLTYVGLSSGGMPEITKLVSASVLRRMAVYAADRSTGQVSDRAPRFLIVDEANFVNRRLLLELLSRARSAGIAVLVCTQGPTDWESAGPGEPDLRSLVQNTNVAIIMRQGELTNAEMCADIIGRAEKQIMTQSFNDGSLTGTGSVRAMVDHLVPPDALRELAIGEAVARVGVPQTWVSWVKVIQRNPRTSARR